MVIQPDWVKIVMIKALVLYGDPARLGGVVNFMETLKNHLSNDIKVEHFLIGRRIVGAGRMFRWLMPFIDAIRLARRVSKDKVDVVHLNPSLDSRSLFRDGLFLAVLRLFGTQKLLVFFHGWHIELEKKICRNALAKWLFTRLYGNNAEIFVLASHVKKSLEKMGFESNRIHVLTSMFDAEQVPRTKKKTKQGMKLLFMSRFDKAKGIYELLEAFNKVHTDYPMASIEFAGDGSEMQGMQAWVKKHKLSERVNFLGYLRGEDKILALEEASLYVLPSYAEGCPVSLLEAMAAGLPVITSAVGGIPDIVVDGVNGLLLQDVTAASIERALRDMLSNQVRLEQIGDTNRKEAWAKFEASIITKRFEKTYNKMINAGE